MRILANVLLALGCAACMGGPAGGVASYDALKTARDQCVAGGGELVLREQGNPQVITHYTCKRK